MQILQIVPLCGPNIWSRTPALEFIVSVSDVSSTFDHRIFRGHILGAFSISSSDELKQIDDDSLSTSEKIAHALVWMTLRLQSVVYTQVDVGSVEATPDPDVCFAAVQFDEEELAVSCLNAAAHICQRALRGDTTDVASALIDLRSVATNVGLGRNTAPLVAAARARGIPVRRLDAESLVQLGHGVKQRRIKTAITDRTGNIATSVSEDKELTKQLLREVGVPVPEGRLVHDGEDAWAAANELGLPVVVKPRDADYGNGVSLDLKTREQVLAAYAAAREFREEVIVEQHISGVLHRLFVVNCEVVAALRREPATVTGDGTRTVHELVAELNRDPRRVYEFTKLKLNDESLEILREQGYTPDSVVPTGVTIKVRRFSHSWAGGTNIDVTDILHPKVAARGVDAARMIGLDVAGLDVVMEDAGRPLEEQRGAVIEVNAGPAMILHLAPMCDQPRPVPEKIMEWLFPQDDEGRIPVAVIVGRDAGTSACRLLANLWESRGPIVARASREGVFAGELLIHDRNGLAVVAASRALIYPRAEAAILETSPESILREGLAVDRCNLAVLIDTCESNEPMPATDRRRALRVIIDSVAPSGHLIVNGDDPELVLLAEDFRGSVISFHRAPLDQKSQGHEDANWRRIYWRDGNVCVWNDCRETIIRDRAALSLLFNGIDLDSPAALATIAVGCAQGLIL